MFSRVETQRAHEKIQCLKANAIQFLKTFTLCTVITISVFLILNTYGCANIENYPIKNCPRCHGFKVEAHINEQDEYCLVDCPVCHGIGAVKARVSWEEEIKGD